MDIIDMKFEELGKKIFNCERSQDIMGYVNANSYHQFVAEPIGIEGKSILFYYLYKILFNFKYDKSKFNNQTFREIEEKIRDAYTQDEIILIIKELELIVEN